MAGSDHMTVGEVEALRPDSEYVKCYRNLCEATGRRFDPDLPYSELPKLFLKEGTKIALAMAFADTVLGTDVWSVRAQPRREVFAAVARRT